MLFIDQWHFFVPIFPWNFRKSFDEPQIIKTPAYAKSYLPQCGVNLIETVPQI